METTTQSGVPVEVWHPRQENGTRQPYHNMRPYRTGYPAKLEFADGKLVAIEKAKVGKE